MPNRIDDQHQANRQGAFFMPKLRKEVINMKIEIRSDSEVMLSGYVNAVERRSAVLSQIICHTAPGNFCEIIKSGVFGASLKRKPEVRLCFNHVRDIGSTSAGLELREDNIGLHAEAVITDAEVVAAAREGRLTGWSFGFTSPVEEWSEPDDKGVYTRSITGLELEEVSILTKRPAYPATSVEVRDGEAQEHEYRTQEEENEVTDLTEKTINNMNVRQAELDLICLKGARNYES